MLLFLYMQNYRENLVDLLSSSMFRDVTFLITHTYTARFVSCYNIDYYCISIYSNFEVNRMSFVTSESIKIIDNKLSKQLSLSQ